MDGIRMTFKCDSDIVKAAARETSRYSLREVLAVKSPAPAGDDAGRYSGWAVATNGRMLACARAEVVVSDPTIGKSVLVPNGAVKREAVASLNGKWEVNRGTARKPKVEVVEPIDKDATFPPVCDVLPNVEDGDYRWISFDAELLAALASAINTPGERVGIALGIGKPNKPMLVVGNNGIGVLMPVNPPSETCNGKRYADDKAEFEAAMSAPVA